MSNHKTGNWFKDHPVISAILTIGPLAAAIVNINNLRQMFFGSSEVVFSCETRTETDGSGTIHETTMAKSGQKYTAIRWKSDYFLKSGYSPERRCREVSPRFQEAYDKKELKYVSYGYMNGQPAICTTASPNSNCENLLLTLRDTDDPKKTMAQLISNLKGRSVGSIPQSGSDQMAIEVDIDAVFGQGNSAR